MALMVIADVFYIITIALAAVSALVSFAGCYLYHIYSKDKSARLLRMITMLVFADGISSLCFVGWYLLNYLNFMDENKLCSLVWPVQLFSFLCAFGLIVFIAERFKRVSTGKLRKEQLNFPLSIVPLVAFLFTLPTIIIDQAIQSTNITELISDQKRDNNQFCFFSSSTMGTIVNYICLQLPSLCTIIYNLRAYYIGVKSLKTASPEVQRRSRFKAGKYLFVLLLVWIPSLTVHAYHSTISPANEPYFPVLVVILLTSCQGIFNAFAYAWEYYPFRKWVYEKVLHMEYKIKEEKMTFAPGIYRKIDEGALEAPFLESSLCEDGYEGENGNTADDPSGLPRGSNKRDHLSAGEVNVRFGSISERQISSVYDDDDDDYDDDEDGAEVDINLQETVDHLGKRVFKFVKRVFKRKKGKKSSSNVDAEETSNLVDQDPKYESASEDGSDGQLDEALCRNTQINSASTYVSSRQRHRARARSRSRSRSRSPEAQSHSEDLRHKGSRLTRSRSPSPVR